MYVKLLALLPGVALGCFWVGPGVAQSTKSRPAETLTVRTIEYQLVPPVIAGQVEEAFQKIGFTTGKVYDPKKVEQARDVIAALYAKRGAASVLVDYRVTRVPPRGLEIAFTAKCPCDSSRIATAATSATASQGEFFVREIDSLALSGLFPKEQVEVRVRLIGRRFDGSQLEELMESVREALQNFGFFAAMVTQPSIEPLATGKAPTPVRLRFRVTQAERRYRLREVRWEGVKAFPVQMIEQLVPLQPGDVFDASKIRAGLEAVRRLYESSGYLHFVSTPSTTIDRDDATIAIVFSAQEGPLMRD